MTVTRQFVLIVHEVDDYLKWKDIFDRAATIRKEAGETRFQVLSDAARPNCIVHFSEWTSLEAARRFFESPDLIEIRRAAGVRAPTFMYLDERAYGDLPESELGG